MNGPTAAIHRTQHPKPLDRRLDDVSHRTGNVDPCPERHQLRKSVDVRRIPDRADVRHQTGVDNDRLVRLPVRVVAAENDEVGVVLLRSSTVSHVRAATKTVAPAWARAASSRRATSGLCLTIMTNPSRGGAGNIKKSRSRRRPLAAMLESNRSLPMRRLPETRKESVLDARELALDRGSFPCLQSFVDDYARDFLESPSPSVRERFTALQVAGKRGTEYEEVHGRYSLLKVNHPFNRELVAKGIVEMSAMQYATQSSALEAAAA
jgi:hypothetical protein